MFTECFGTSFASLPGWQDLGGSFRQFNAGIVGRFIAQSHTHGGWGAAGELRVQSQPGLGNHTVKRKEEREKKKRKEER